MAPSLLSTTAIYLTLIFSSFVREQAQRRQIRSAFGQYLSPALVEQLAQSPEKLVLGGEEREMTIMFSDVRRFTTVAEELAARGGPEHHMGIGVENSPRERRRQGGRERFSPHNRRQLVENGAVAATRSSRG